MTEHQDTWSKIDGSKRRNRQVCIMKVIKNSCKALCILSSHVHIWTLPHWWKSLGLLQVAHASRAMREEELWPLAWAGEPFIAEQSWKGSPVWEDRTTQPSHFPAMKNLPFPPSDNDWLVYHDVENVGRLCFVILFSLPCLDSLSLTYVPSGTFYGAEPVGPWKFGAILWQPLVPYWACCWLQSFPPGHPGNGVQVWRSCLKGWVCSSPWRCYPLPRRWWYGLSCRQNRTCREKEPGITFSSLDKEKVKFLSSGILKGRFWSAGIPVEGGQP